LSKPDVELTCPRCGIEHTMKLDTLKKRTYRNQPNPKYCVDCFEPRKPDNTEIWERYQANLIANGS
jgi:hypothetical protein